MSTRILAAVAFAVATFGTASPAAAQADGPVAPPPGSPGTRAPVPLPAASAVGSSAPISPPLPPGSGAPTGTVPPPPAGSADASPSAAPPSLPTAGAEASVTPTPPKPEPPEPPRPPPSLQVPSPRRALPDYDGRGQRPTTVGDVVIWIPRGLLAPFYLVTERLLRTPLGFVVATADKNHWPVTVLGFFTFGPSQQAGIFPTAFFDFGLRPSVGLYGYVDRFFHPANRLTYQVGTWGPSWLSFSVKDQVTVAKDALISLGASYNRRPDQPFYGRGPRSHSRDESRYGLTAVEVPLRLDVRFSHAVRLLAGAGLRTIRFHGSDCCGDPDISVPIAQGRFAAPPGYPGGYNALFTGAELVVDSRPRRPKNQTGARVAAHAEHGFDPSPTAPSNWLKWGGNAGAYFDLGRQRTVGLKGNVLFAERLRGTLPFLEEPSLGGFGLMRGYLQNRLVDRSALVGELEYRWPVWVFLDGTLQASVGNVFGTHLDELRAKLLRLSGAIGVRSNNSADHQLEVLVGFGTETFGEGLPISSIRIFVGGTNGF